MVEGDAYWISPNCDIYEVKTKHINFVGENPELFWITHNEYLNYFKKYSEPIGWEGYARKEMFNIFFENGWIRIRENSQTGWTIELWQLTDKAKENIALWGASFGVNGGKFNSTNIKVNCTKGENNEKIQYFTKIKHVMENSANHYKQI